MPDDQSNSPTQFPTIKLCNCCRVRESRGMGWFNPSSLRSDRRYYFACSYECLGMIMKNKGPLPPTNSERQAISHAGREAGDYLNALGKTDLKELEVDEWMELIQGICMSYAEFIQVKAASEDIPT